MKRKKRPTAAGFEPARVTPWDFKSHALTTRPNSLCILSKQSHMALWDEVNASKAARKLMKGYLPMRAAQ